MSWFAQPGHAVDRVERAHRGVRTRVDRGLERRQVEVAQRGLGHVGGVVLAAALRGTVGGEVLDTGGHLVRRRVVAALVTLDPGRGERRTEVRVLAAALGDPAPAWFVRDVHHRAVDLLEPHGRRLAGADGGVGLGDRRVERAGRAERDGEHRPVPVDGVEGEHDRDVQPGLLHRDVLQVVDLRRVDLAEHPTEARLGLGVSRLPVGQQLDLLQLLLGGHLRDQRGHLVLDGRVGCLLGSGRAPPRPPTGCRPPRRRPPPWSAPPPRRLSRSCAKGGS